MEFSEYVQGLKPFLSIDTMHNKKSTHADLFVAIIGNFINDAAMDNCELLNRRTDTQYRYTTGKNKIQSQDAMYVYQNRDTNKYSKWISECMEGAESYEAIQDWLKKYGYPGIYPDDECTQLLEEIILSICNKSDKQKKTLSEFEKSLELIKDINDKIKSLPRPTPIPVPSIATDKETIYINELMCAYGDAQSIDNFTDSDFKNYPDYKDDLEDRRIDFYAAVTIKRGIMELQSDELSNQFTILKDETLSGIKDTARKKYSDGYEKLLSVMEQAVCVPLSSYLLTPSPYWINSEIKKGVCHHLVNDGKLRWVKKK